MGLFDLISVLYALMGLRTLATAWQNRRALTDAELTAPDRAILSQLAFFVLVPPGVLMHELGHALATLQLGGHVAEFHFALFYGYIVPVGSFSALGEWWIALSGNLVSIVYGLLALPLLFVVRAAWQKYLLLAFARVQLTWALIGYPLFTLLGFGDWTTIYNPATWQVGLPFGVFHALLILGLWLLNRNAGVKRWELSLFAGMSERLGQTERNLAAQPENANGLVDRGNLYAQNNMLDAAQQDYTRALRMDPGNPRALYNLGQIDLGRKQFRSAETRFRAALDRAVGDARLATALNYALGLALFQQGKREEAVAAFDRALGYEPEVPEFHYWRGMALRALRQDVRARAAFQRAADLASGTDPALAQQARNMLRETQP